jgi:hypothetical protein
LGVLDGDWSAWYRMFSREQFKEERLAQTFLVVTLQEVPESEPYVWEWTGCKFRAAV